MEKKLAKIALAILVLCPVCAYSTDITFTSSGSIVDGNVFGTVTVQNNGTIVNMSGGQINDWLYTYNASTFNMSNGQITGGLYMSYLSKINIYGGTINTDSDFVAMDGSTCDISGGDITVGRLKTYNASAFGSDSIVNITGGNINFDIFEVHGVINIYRGLLYVDDSWIGGWGNDQPIINIYGSAFNYSPSTQILTGYLLDNNPFTIKGVDSIEYTRFNLIPEPISVMLFGFGLLSIRKHKKEV